MYRSITLEENIALKEVISNRFQNTNEDFTPHNWRETLTSTDRTPIPEITVTNGNTEEHFSLANVADAIGESLTDLLIARKRDHDTIFNDENRSFVSAVAHSVSKRLMEQVQKGNSLKLSQNDLYLLIEKALIENDAHDVAKSLVFKRSLQNNGEISLNEEPATMPVRLIRRNGNVVPWSETKIESATARAFLTLEEDPAAAHDIAKAVTARVRESEEAFVHIEDVQDFVQEELMRQGHFKVAAHYVRYRDDRSRMRELQTAPAEDPNQESFVTVTRDGQSDLWNGQELKKRIQFASIGLKLTLSEDELERELRRSIGAEISAEDLQKTICLNARALIEKDADMAKFAGRILLSYISVSYTHLTLPTKA